eukprot:6284090-Amphidinium_carterae.1
MSAQPSPLTVLLCEVTHLGTLEKLFFGSIVCVYSLGTYEIASEPSFKTVANAKYRCSIQQS